MAGIVESAPHQGAGVGLTGKAMERWAFQATAAKRECAESAALVGAAMQPTQHPPVVGEVGHKGAV